MFLLVFVVACFCFIYVVCVRWLLFCVFLCCVVVFVEPVMSAVCACLCIVACLF